MLNRNDKARIDRYIHKTADANDIIRLEELLSNGHKNRDLRDYLAEDWNNTPAAASSSETELRRFLDRIHHIIRNKENQKRQLFLQSATRIYYTRLIYPTPFKNNRKVSLEGEAWFDVTQDDKSPFLITAGNSLVKVLGTSFNVCAYQSDHYIEVILRQGKVEFY